MDGSIDLRLVVTLAGMLVSVVAASAVAKMQIKVILERLDDMELRFRALDSTTDTLGQRMAILSGMLSPDNLRRDHMTLAELLTNVRQMQDDITHLEKMHNTVHPPVKDTRKAS